MKAALSEAHNAFSQNEVPVGAVIVVDNVVISSSHNMTEHNSIAHAHAEILAIEGACKVLGEKYLTNASLFVTLEPCPMCAHAISLAKIQKLYFGAYDNKGGGVVNGPKIFDSTSCNHKPEIYDGIMEKECSELLTLFFKQRR
jgi:tRNA(adenine34) deaminase